MNAFMLGGYPTELGAGDGLVDTTDTHESCCRWIRTPGYEPGMAEGYSLFSYAVLPNG